MFVQVSAALQLHEASFFQIILAQEPWLQNKWLQGTYFLWFSYLLNPHLSFLMRVSLYYLILFYSSITGTGIIQIMTPWASRHSRERALLPSLLCVGATPPRLKQTQDVNKHRSHVSAEDSSVVILHLFTILLCFSPTINVLSESLQTVARTQDPPTPNTLVWQ